MNINRFKLGYMIASIVLLASCMNIAEKKTTAQIMDNDRHYFPILAGQKKQISFQIKNTGENPLLVTDIIPSCGCLEINGGDKLFSIPPGKERALSLTYNSAKNIGYVKHYITLYGNFAKESEELIFDIHVVPDNHYTKDYEELYQAQAKKTSGVRRLVDGDENDRGYYVDNNELADP